LKDSWIDVDRITEGRLLEDIHATLQPDAEYQPYLQHLLEPDYYGFVPNEAGMRVETFSLSRWDSKPSSSHFLQLNGGSGKKLNLESVQGGSLPLETGDHAAKTGRRRDSRKRIRTVFVEGPGKELGELDTLGKVFTAIKGGLNGAYRYAYIFITLKCDVQLYWRCTAPAIFIEISASGTLFSCRGKAINLAAMKTLVC
jgi:hypothetical protein